MTLVHSRKWAADPSSWHPRRWLFELIDRLKAWHGEAADRRYLAGLNDHNLRDLGLSRHDVDRDVPFRDRYW